MERSEKREELENLNQRIKEEIEKANQLQVEINEKTEKLIDQNVKLIEAKTMRNEALFAPKMPNKIDMSDFPQDYIDHVKEKSDETIKLQNDFEASKDMVDNRINEINHLIEMQLKLMCELTKTNYALYQQELENVSLKKKRSLNQNHFKEYSILIKEAEQIRIKAEMALSTTLQRAENYDLVNGGEIDIKNSILNAKEQIKKIDEKINEGLKLLNKYQNEDFDEKNKFDQNMNNLKTLYSFDSQYNETSKEFQELKQSIQNDKTEFQKLKEIVDQKEKRLSVLLPLTEKLKKSKVLSTQVQQFSTVDQLIQKLSSCEKDIKKMVGKKNDSLSFIVKQNQVLEKRIDARYREYQIMISKYSIEQQVLKKKIEETKNYNYEREYNIIETIKKTEIKVHENVQKNISSTKPRKQNFSTFLLESPNPRRANYSEM